MASLRRYRADELFLVVVGMTTETKGEVASTSEGSTNFDDHATKKIKPNRVSHYFLQFAIASRLSWHWHGINQYR